MRKVSYATFCMFGALGNPRFFTRAVYSQGKFLHTEYWDLVDGPLYWSNANA